MNKKWNMLEGNTAEAEQLASEAHISILTSRLLINRGIKNAKQARAFIYPENEQQFYDPFLMKDMDAAVSKIIKSIEDKEKIVVYGDYDVDGITATTLLVSCLKEIGADVSYYIPNRQGEGYGFNSKALNKLYENGFSLLISVDCGISCHKEVEEMQGKLSIVITDHHQPPEDLPAADAVINPHRSDCGYPDKNLAGVGVAFKLCQALVQRINKSDYQENLELVALGTVADIVPLVGENRRLVKQGLKALKKTKNSGIKALAAVAGAELSRISTETVSFGLAPRLNAAGRLFEARLGVELLLTDDKEKALSIAGKLNSANQERQCIEQEIQKQVEEMLAGQDVFGQHVIVIAGEEWHQGVIGIVASKIVNRYYKPAIIISVHEGMGKGSCRSIKGFNMFEALSSAKDVLSGFGGHPMAAGLSLPEQNIDVLRQKLEEYAIEHMKPDDYIPEINIEAEVSPEQITFELVEELAMLEPYGAGNPRPVFSWNGIQGYFARRMGRDEKPHLSFRLSAEREAIRAVGWNMADDYFDIVEKQLIDIAFFPEINEYFGDLYLQCKLEDIRASRIKTEVSREELRMIYVFLRQKQQAEACIKGSITALSAECNISEHKMQMAMRILEELHIVRFNEYNVRYFKAPAKGVTINLDDSPTFRKQFS